MPSKPTPGPKEQFCTSCGAVIKEQATLCPDCGADNDGGPSGPSDFHYCESCGLHIQSDPELCPDCGVRQHSGKNWSDGESVLLWVFGGFAILAALSQIASPGADIASSILTGLVFLAIGILALPPVHQRIERADDRHSLTTFGNVKSVKKYPVSRYDGACAICDGSVEEGTRREYAEEFAVFGLVLSTADSGSNVYCQSCALLEDNAESARIDSDEALRNPFEKANTPETTDTTESGEADPTFENQSNSRSIERTEE
ncbi:hypothetical protein ACFQJ7_09445 [Halovenus rubra]|uniref:DUF8108 domain-containing protein n=2 Tax=Halovenus rubra TaxID=869890 RepID=A0ABD5X4Y6_9EURY|nr:hypothetical protein [Halovenus rubra]